uniref:DUF4237 domain containing protein n=1 Tax=Papaver somniferum TaxID=3469 RepID=A0A5B7LL35_PAPSO|nr:DUF4237 domain containing protein [Papaver somniferum]
MDELRSGIEQKSSEKPGGVTQGSREEHGPKPFLKPISTIQARLGFQPSYRSISASYGRSIIAHQTPKLPLYIATPISILGRPFRCIPPSDGRYPQPPISPLDPPTIVTSHRPDRETSSLAETAQHYSTKHPTTPPNTMSTTCSTISTTSTLQRHHVFTLNITSTLPPFLSLSLALYFNDFTP